MYLTSAARIDDCSRIEMQLPIIDWLALTNQVIMSDTNAVNVITCSFGNGCKHPATDLLVDCKPNCKQRIHRLCGEECPYHVCSPDK